MDALRVQRLTKTDQTRAHVVIGVAILASQTEISNPDPTHIFIENQNPTKTSGGFLQKESSTIKEEDIQSEARVGKDTLTNSTPTALENPNYVKDLEKGVRTVLRARADFINGVIVPVVLLLATTGSSFHDAYLQLGNNDTAHGLACGIWYSWLIILAVLSNSYISSVNPGLAKDAIGNLVHLHPRTTPLRMRARTAYDWRWWMDTILKESFSVTHQSRPASFHVGYFCAQTVAWACVAFICSCAAAISYNTPTIGIGCRSFSFLLYGVLAIILAWLMVIRAWTAPRFAQNDAPKSLTARFLQYLYGCITFLKAFVLIFSTIAQLVGLFRSCFCTHFGPLSDVVELSTGTDLTIHKAAVTWLPVGFVAYAGVWIVCVVAVGFRMFNNSRIESSWGKNTVPH